MASLLDRIKGFFNRNKRLAEVNSQQIEDSNVVGNTDVVGYGDKNPSFDDELSKIYAEEDLASSILSEMGVNSSIIDSEIAMREIMAHVESILSQEGMKWPEKSKRITPKERDKIVGAIKKNAISPEMDKVHYTSEGVEKYGILVNEAGNVILNKTKIKSSDSKTLGDDEFVSETISVDRNGDVHRDGYAVLLNYETIYKRNESEATRDFSATYSKDGKRQGLVTHRYAKENGEKVLVSTNRQDFDETDIKKRDEIINNINEKGKPEIDRLLKENPDFFTKLDPLIRRDIIEVAIDYDLSCLQYDTTNDSNLYKKYAQKAKEMLSENYPKVINEGKESQFNTEDSPMYPMYYFRKVIQEIDNPKSPEPGKYKIPQKYLFETLRMGAKGYGECIKESNSDITSIANALLGEHALGIGTTGNISDYLCNDCVVPEEFGKKMQELYENNDYYLIQHRYKDDGETTDKAEIAFTMGKKESEHDPVGQAKNLGCTFTGMFNNTAGFAAILTQFDRILALVPKDALDNIETQNKIWGSDEEKGVSYLLPEFIIGKVTKNNEFIENPVPVEERHQYKYKHKDKSIEDRITKYKDDELKASRNKKVESKHFASVSDDDCR